MNVTILLGSIRLGRQSHKAGHYLKQELEKKAIDVSLIDLAETPLPMFGENTEQPVAVRKKIKAIGETLKEADALLFVTPEYHGSFSGALKNALEYYWSEFQKKPIGVVTASSGRMGGINASIQLQHVILSLGAYALPLKLLIPDVEHAFDDSFHSLKESVTNSANKFINEFIWFAEAVVEKKKESIQA